MTSTSTETESELSLAGASMSAKSGPPKMRAARLVAAQRWETHECRLPEPQPGQVRVRIEGCGVCGSNLPPWEGRPWFRYPFDAGAPGHEGWGVVDQIGDGVTDLNPGDRVTMLSYHAFAEYDVVEAAAAVRLPEELRERPFPGEALGCAMNVWRRADVQSTHTVAIVGAGFLGLLLAQLAVQSGARVIVINRRQQPLEVARRFGADHRMAFEGDVEATAAQVLDLTDGAGCERVIEATGYAEPLDLAGRITGVRGRLLIAGYHQDGLRHINMQEWNWKGIDVINAHERDPAMYRLGMSDAVDAVLAGRLDPTPLYTHMFNLKDINDAFAVVKDRPDDFIKSLVVMR